MIYIQYIFIQGSLKSSQLPHSSKIVLQFHNFSFIYSQDITLQKRMIEINLPMFNS